MKPTGTAHDFADPHDPGELELTEDGGARWYQLRPKPRGRYDFLGFNSKWWMALGWILLIDLVIL